MSIDQISSLSASAMIPTAQSSYGINTDSETSTSNISTQSYSVSSNIRTVSAFAREYDVTNMSANQMIEMSEDLYDNGVISLRTSGVLILRALANEDVSPDASRNFVAELQDSLDSKIKSGAEASSIESTKEALSFLENMAALRNEIIGKQTIV